MIEVKKLELGLTLGSFHNVEQIDYQQPYLRVVQRDKISILWVIPEYDIDSGNYLPLELAPFGEVQSHNQHHTEYITSFHLTGVVKLTTRVDAVGLTMLDITTKSGLTISFEIYEVGYVRY